MGREAQRSEQELYSPVSITRTENIVTHGLFIMYTKKLHVLYKCHFHKEKMFVEVSSIRIDHLLFTQNNPIYQKRLGRIRPDHNSKIIANGKRIFHLDI